MHHKKASALAFAAVCLCGVANADSITAPKPSFQYSGQQIVDRMNEGMAHPARYTGMFKSSTGIGRLATITHCTRKGSAPGNAFYTCDLTGVPVGTTGNLLITLYHHKVSSVAISMQNDIKADVGLTSVATMLAEGALISAVDPQAHARGMSSKTHEELIMDGLSPGPTMNLTKTVRADGLTFRQQMMLGDLVLDVSPTGASAKR